MLAATRKPPPKKFAPIRVHSRAIRRLITAVPNYAELEQQILEFIEDEGSARFDDLALAIHGFQKAHCPPLHRYSESLCPQPERWQDIPAVPTEAFKNDEFPVACAPPGGAAKTFLTSGTTGEARGAHHFISTRLYEQSIRSAWRELDLPDLPLICLTQPPALSPESSLIHMFATLDGRFLIGSDGVLDPALLAKLITNTRGPFLLAGTALSFLHLFESGTQIPPLPDGSHALETGGYKGSGREISKSDLYTMFGRHLGLPPGRIINEYSMTELSSQFYTTGLGEAHRSPALAEGAGAETGQQRRSRGRRDGRPGHLRSRQPRLLDRHRHPRPRDQARRELRTARARPRRPPARMLAVRRRTPPRLAARPPDRST